MASPLKGDDHHQGKHMKKKKQPSLKKCKNLIDEKKEMTITKVSASKEDDEHHQE